MSWLITTRPPRWALRKSRSQTIESASRWLVGSSSSSVSAPENRIRASSTRRRWPPERVRSGWPRIRSSMPEAVGDLRGLGLRGVPAAGVQLGVGAARSGASRARGRPGRRCPSRPRPRAAGVRRRRGRARTGSGRGRAPRGRRCAGPAGGSRPSPVRVHRPGGGQRLAGEDLGEGGLAGAVAADQADLVARRPRGRSTSSIRSRAPARTSRCWAVIIRVVSVWPQAVPLDGGPPNGRGACAMRFNPKARLDTSPGA